MNLIIPIITAALGFIIGRQSRIEKIEKEKCCIVSKLEENREYLNFLNYCGDEQE